MKDFGFLYLWWNVNLRVRMITLQLFIDVVTHQTKINLECICFSVQSLVTMIEIN